METEAVHKALWVMYGNLTFVAIITGNNHRLSSEQLHCQYGVEKLILSRMQVRGK